jgi:FtsP/CotA-like multicopper oxidase with cupredoxin domain
MRTPMLRFWFLAFCLSTLPCVAQQSPPPASAGKTRMYYISADEVEWDYAPHNMDHMTGKPFDKATMIFVEKGKDRIGQVYRKAIYREYTDATFQSLKPRPAEDEHMGILGPVIRAEVGDTIEIVFRNNATQPYSMHPHGVFYAKDSEGAPYAGMSPESTGLVAPGQTHKYTWKVPERAGPGPDDGSSVVWLYHSHNYEPKDVNAGLIGPMVITAKGMARPDGSPRDVDREIFALFMIIDENQSHYFQHNIDTYAGDPKAVKKLELNPADADGNADLTLGSGFALVNHKFTINGYIFGNNPPMQMHKGERVRWYLMSMGDGFNFHTPHWHGNVVTVDKHRTDILILGPAQFVVADMTPDNVGTWMFHCHLSDHMKGGMMTDYEVLP